MRISDIIFIGIIIAIFIVPIEKFNSIYKLNSKILLFRLIPIKKIPIIIKILLSTLWFVLYLFLDSTNIPTLLFSNLDNKVFYPIILKVLAPVTGEVLVATVGLMFTILTLFYTSITNLRKNDTEVIFKLVDLIENNIKVIKEEKVYDEIENIKSRIEDKDLRRIFLLKKTLIENKIKLKTSLRKSSDENLNDEQKLSLVKMNDLLDETDISFANLEKLMSLLIRKDILTFTSHPYKRTLIKSYLSNKEFSYIEKETTFFDILVQQYDYLLVLKKTWINIDFIKYVFNKHAENDQSLNNIFRLIHRAIKITNNSSLPYLEKKNMIGIIRTLIPDYLLIYIFYNCTYTKRGSGLAMQLVGTSFFGTKSDFEDNNNFSQHFRSSTLIFKDLDSAIMKYVYDDIKIKPGNCAADFFDSKVIEIINSLDKKA